MSEPPGTTTGSRAENSERYAELLVTHGMNVQEDQVVLITAEACHRDFALQVARAAYRKGARYVDLDLLEQRLARLRILESSESGLKFVPRYVTERSRDLVDETAAMLRLIGSEDPDVLSDLDPGRMNDVRLANYEATRYFHEEGIGRSKVQWTVAAAATPKWGRKVFPDLDETAAGERLWEEIFRMTRADRPNCLELWREHNQKLHERSSRLTQVQIRELHFLGPGTDLHVGLSPVARFCGGTETSPRGVPFEPNIPTEEVFTTPDYRRTRGRVRATRPFHINGKLIEGLEMEFADGVLSSFHAREGEETFRRYVESDVGGKRLGEVALVGIDSPVYQSGLVFEEILFDENAACHIAVGSAYKVCIDGGDQMKEDELAAIGCNESSVHTDIMISSEEVDVTATTYSGDEVKLIRSGQWVP